MKTTARQISALMPKIELMNESEAAWMLGQLDYLGLASWRKFKPFFSVTNQRVADALFRKYGA